MTSPSAWAVAALLLLAYPAAAQTITGPAWVVDGDTITVQYQRIRLWGIDAPERAQTCEGAAGVYECGRDASAALAAILRGRSVSCEKRDTDRYGRMVAQCSTEAGDIGAEMVRQGWAVDYSQYSHGRYAAWADPMPDDAGLWANPGAPDQYFHVWLRFRSATAPSEVVFRTMLGSCLRGPLEMYGEDEKGDRHEVFRLGHDETSPQGCEKQ